MAGRIGDADRHDAISTGDARYALGVVRGGRTRTGHHGAVAESGVLTRRLLIAIKHGSGGLVKDGCC